MLSNSAIHVDHDHCLIDIDSGQEVYHFKVLSPLEFQDWRAIIEKFTETKPNSSDNPDFLHSSIINLDQKFGIHSMDSDIHDMNTHLMKVLESLTESIKKMKEIADSSKGRIDSKSSWKGVFFTILILDFMNIIVNFALMSDSLSEEVRKIQKYLVAYSSKIQNYRQQASNVFQVLEFGYISAIKNNNSIRTKFGLDPISIQEFLPPDFDDMGIISTGLGGISSLRKSSISSMNQYYDAESGKEDDLESETSSYSSSEPETMAMDQSSALTENFDNESSSSLAVETPPETPELLEAKLLDRLTISPATQNLLLGTVIQSKPHPPHTLVRRAKLKHPTISMENINLMGILRNNVSIWIIYD